MEQKIEEKIEPIAWGKLIGWKSREPDSYNSSQFTNKKQVIIKNPNPIIEKEPTSKKVLSGISNFLVGIEISREKKKYNISKGDVILINKGMYYGNQMMVEGFVEGGVVGKVGNKIIKIRHESYTKLT